MGFAQLFDLRSGSCESAIETAELPAGAATEHGIRKNVIEAHRTLMAMSQDNKAAFEALVKNPRIELKACNHRRQLFLVLSEFSDTLRQFFGSHWVAVDAIAKGTLPQWFRGGCPGPIVS